MNKTLRLAVFVLFCAIVAAGAFSLRDIHPTAYREMPTASGGDVAWRKWTPDAFRAARASGRPILLVVTASWCHWCHVMDDTTFSDPDIVRIIAKDFIPVRVDADRWPDVRDHFAPEGLPATSFLAPDGLLSIKSNFVPPAPFKALLAEVHAYYVAHRSEVARNSRELLKETVGLPAAKPPAKITAAPIDRLSAALRARADIRNGGFSGRGKYPDTDALRFLLHAQFANDDAQTRAFIELTLASMKSLEDPIWGGFFRYANGDDWSAPDTEKLLSVNASVARTYLDASAALQDRKLLSTALRTLKYIDQFLADPRGGYYGSQNSDLGTAGGIVSGQEFYRLGPAQRRAAGMPSIDRHLFVDANAHMVSALFRAYALTGNEDFRREASATLGRLIREGLNPKTGMPHVLRAGPDASTGLLQDQVETVSALLDAYEITGATDYLKSALALQSTIDALWWDKTDGGYLHVAHGTMPAGFFPYPDRPIDANALACENLLRLWYITADARFLKHARRVAFLLSPAAETVSSAGTALFRFLRPPLEITILGAKSDPRSRALHKAALPLYAPWKVILPLDPTEDRARIAKMPYRVQPQPTLYACAASACALPLSDPEQVVPRLTLFIQRFVSMQQQ